MGTQTPQALGAATRCNKCGFCQAVCAHYQATREEWSVARGLLRLVRAVSEGQLTASGAYAERLFACTLCGGCTVACPSGLEIERSLLEARRALVEEGRLPEALTRLVQEVSSGGDLHAHSGSTRLGWAHNLGFELPLDGTHDMVYFAGCLPSEDPALHATPQGMVRLLRRAGADFTVLGAAEVCCGYPLWINGLTDAARDLARLNSERVRAAGARRVLTTCPSCYRAWRELYPALLGQPLGIEVIHATQWLHETGASPLAAPDRSLRATYHDPCNLGRRSGVYDAPRQVLARCAGLQMVEMANTRAEALCCGAGGYLVERLDPALTRAVARLRLEQALATGAELLVTACPQCERTLRSARTSEAEIAVVDVVALFGSFGAV